MAKRIHDIAKELGIQSKAIIDKCVAEGIPADKVKNHMASISPGLEASIREWFSESSAAQVTGSSTAVETTAHVDVEKVRVAPRRRAAARKAAPTTESPAEPGRPAEPSVGVATAVEARSAPRPQTPAYTSPEEPGSSDNGESDGDVALAEPPAPQTVAAPAAQPAAPAHPTVVTAPPASESPPPPTRRVITPAPMNVPERPKVVSPAGRKLEIKSPVKLSGPKVVRIEAPEVMDRPRARREPTPSDAPGGRGVPGGTGAGAGAKTDDDQGRSPRRNKRRPDAPASPARGGVPARRKGISGEEAPAAGGKWTEQDLAEREARLQRSGGFLKKRRHELKLRQGAQPGERAASAAQTGGAVKIVAPFTIKDLSAATGVKVSEIIKKLFLQGVMATANSGIETEKAQEMLIEYNIELEVVEARSAEQVVSDQFAGREAVEIRARGPVVTILGHVDHGKTSLLDKIRHTNVAAGEAGGITQATSAFRVPVTIAGETKHIVFLDTPGHEAFTSMRARGANMTDIVVLVVSAPEGVMPQTIESINHAKAAGVPIVVALNKIDRADATEARVNQTLKQLADHGVSPTAWGGTTEAVRTSATTGEGVNELLEILDLQGQLLELKADFDGPGRGTVIESRMQEGRGATANVLVQNGRLRVGDFIVVGRAFGRVRDIIDDHGDRLKEVGPAHPVQISGFDELPDPGDKFYIVESLRQAQDAAEQRRQRERQSQLAQPKVTLDSLFSQMAASDTKEILVVLKADVQGSVDVLKSEIEKIATDEVKVRVLHAAVGGIAESDVLLADASKAIIIGFNVIPAGKARHLAEAKSVEIRSYQVIYEITDDVRKAAEGLLEPEMRQEILGHAEVRKVFKVTKVGTIAGCYVTDGLIERNALIRVTRDGIVIENDRVLEQLKRFKDDAKEVKNGNECGMKIVGYDDIKEGDVLECYKNVQVKRTL